MLRPLACAAFAVSLLAALPEPADGQTRCREGALGAVTCLGPTLRTPPQRPDFTSRTRGIDRVIVREPTGSEHPDLIPARRQNSLGTTLLESGEAEPSRRCRTDTLGNLRCR